MSMNDMERLGLPRDIDLLDGAIAALRRKPESRRRQQHLMNLMIRVQPQLKEILEKK